jgi:hypothetical protein
MPDAPRLIDHPERLSPRGRKFLRKLYMADFASAVDRRDEDEVDGLLERLAVLDALIDADDRAAERPSARKVPVQGDLNGSPQTAI